MMPNSGYRSLGTSEPALVSPKWANINRKKPFSLTYQQDFKTLAHQKNLNTLIFTLRALVYPEIFILLCSAVKQIQLIRLMLQEEALA